MAKFIALHTLACLTRQGAEELAGRLNGAQEVKASRILLNLYEGKMLTEFEAENREALVRWLESEAIHFDWLMRIELEFADGALKQAAP
jgi:hypothetical protein